jgi:hypothetical protein
MNKYFSDTDTDTDTDDNPSIKPKSLQNKQFAKKQNKHKVKKYKFYKKKTWIGIILSVLFFLALIYLFKKYYKSGPKCNN